MGVKFKPFKSIHKFKFGDNQHNSLGYITMRIPIHGHKMIVEQFDVVKANVPFFIGLDFLDRYNLYINTVSNELCAPEVDI